jgi:N-acetyl-anhydromuramyl-L-alanine amidase AmpD
MNAPKIIQDHVEREIIRSRTNLAVIHAMGERIDDGVQIYQAPEWLKKLKLAVHAFIRPDGTIVEMLHLDRKAAHAAGFNHRSIGCEILVPAPEGGGHNITTFYRAIGIDPATKRPMDPLPHSPYTPAQYQSAGWWYARAVSQYPEIPSTEEGIKSHEEIDLQRTVAKGKPKRKFDPGPLWDWNEFWHWFEEARGEFA